LGSNALADSKALAVAPSTDKALRKETKDEAFKVW
jgi:hypothetical protein